MSGFSVRGNKKPFPGTGGRSKPASKGKPNRPGKDKRKKMRAN